MWRSKVALPLVATAFTCLRARFNPAPEHDSEQLFPHTPMLPLRLDFVSIDDSATIGERAGGIAIGNCPRRLLSDASDDLKRTLSVTIADMRTQPHACSVCSQSPIGGKRNRAVAIAAADRTCPEI